MIRPKKLLTIDINAFYNRIASRFTVRAVSKLAITFDIREGVSISLMKRGNVLIRGSESKKEALSIYEDCLELVKRESCSNDP